MQREPGTNEQKLAETANALVALDKGLLALDESNPTCNKRFARYGIPQTEEMRRNYRELIVTTEGLGEFIGGAILYDETIRQKKKDGTPLIKLIIDAGIIPGIKVDGGVKEMAGQPGEHICEGLDGLRARLAEYSQLGPVLPNGARSLPLEMVFPARLALKPMPTRWPVMPRCARKLAWCLLSNRKCLWTVIIHWKGAAK